MSEDRSPSDQPVSSGSSRVAAAEASATTAPLPAVDGTGRDMRAATGGSGSTPNDPDGAVGAGARTATSTPSTKKAAAGATVRPGGRPEPMPPEDRVTPAADTRASTPDHNSAQTVPSGDPPAPHPGPISNLPPVTAVPRPQRRTGTARQDAKAATRAGARRARLALRRIDPISVFVLSLIISIFLGIVLLVAVGLLYLLLERAGVLSSIDTFARELSLIKSDATILPFNRVATVTGIVAAVDVVVLTVLATLAAVLYNLCASLTGGVEVTLSERE